MTEEWQYKGDFPIDQAIKKDIGKGIILQVCPLCKDHEFTGADEVRDCKNDFYEQIGDKKIVRGQCCCYAVEHGVRK